MSKMTLYFLEKHLEDGLSLDELNLLAKSSGVYHQELFPLQVQSNNSVMYGFLPGSLMERSDITEEALSQFLTNIMDSNIAPGTFPFADNIEIVVERFGKDLLADKLFVFDRMFTNTCGFTMKMMHAAGDALRDPELLADFDVSNLVQLDSIGQRFVMTKDAYDAAALDHELKDAEEMAMTALISHILNMNSEMDRRSGCHSGIPESEDEIKKVLNSFYISDWKLNEMVSEVAQRFVGDHDSDISDNEQIQNLVEEVVSDHMSYVDHCMAEGIEINLE